MYSWNRSLSYAPEDNYSSVAKKRGTMLACWTASTPGTARLGKRRLTKSCRRVDGVARLSCVWTWTRLLLLLLLIPSTLGQPWVARREKIRSRPNILASIQIWRLFIANGCGDLLPLRIDATDSQFRRPLPSRCGLFFGYHVLYLLPDVKGSEPSLLHF